MTPAALWAHRTVTHLVYVIARSGSPRPQMRDGVPVVTEQLSKDFHNCALATGTPESARPSPASLTRAARLLSGNSSYNTPLSGKRTTSHASIPNRSTHRPRVLGVSLPDDRQQCSVGLRGQPLEIKALQDGTQMLITARLEVALLCPIEAKQTTPIRCAPIASVGRPTTAARTAP